jgi:hypothetical protein
MIFDILAIVFLFLGFRLIYGMVAERRRDVFHYVSRPRPRGDVRDARRKKELGKAESKEGRGAGSRGDSLGQKQMSFGKIDYKK